MTDKDTKPEGKPNLEVLNNKEIERKFLVAYTPEDLERHERTYIDQGYLAIEDGGNEVRVRCKATSRQEGGKFTLTVKSGAGLSRDEFETEMRQWQFHEVWPGTEGRRIQKTRYEIPHGRNTIELDVYDGDLDGLLVAEVEFADEESAAQFVPPEWFAGEVTDDPAYKNQQLAVYGLPADMPPAI